MMTDGQDESESPSDKRTVLIAEDEVGLADLFAVWLSDSYEVETAYDGREAVKKLDESTDVLLLDRRMPHLSGDEVLERIRDESLDCRVVIVSAVTPDFDVIGMGFDEYLTKPVDRDELRDAVERMIDRADYDQLMQELNQLVSTRATLREQKSESELLASEEYRRLEERISELKAEADASLADSPDEAFDYALRDFYIESDE